MGVLPFPSSFPPVMTYVIDICALPPYHFHSLPTSDRHRQPAGTEYHADNQDAHAMHPHAPLDPEKREPQLRPVNAVGIPAHPILYTLSAAADIFVHGGVRVEAVPGEQNWGAAASGLGEAV